MCMLMHSATHFDINPINEEMKQCRGESEFKLTLFLEQITWISVISCLTNLGVYTCFL